ncbi:PREDICTED: uncharacterized protein LOC108691018 [Atta colombica]|uniref:uncharacterized protein LOC108691018 n=1 Tax=Atta colombica TaxID=520822 RepID=UPI00084C41B7|nr:PREDICTED: uncharacterized protein LOC108691018 [Atta colombica]
MEERNGSALATPYTGSVEGPRDYRRWLASVWSRRRPCAHHSSDATCPPPLFRACLGCDTRSRDLQNLSVYRLLGIPAYTDIPVFPLSRPLYEFSTSTCASWGSRGTSFTGAFSCP